MIIDDAVYEKLKKQVQKEGSVTSMLGLQCDVSLVLKSNEEFELSIKNYLGNVIYLNQDAIADLELILTFKKEIRDRWEAR